MSSLFKISAELLGWPRSDAQVAVAGRLLRRAVRVRGRLCGLALARLH